MADQAPPWFKPAAAKSDAPEWFKPTGSVKQEPIPDGPRRGDSILSPSVWRDAAANIGRTTFATSPSDTRIESSLLGGKQELRNAVANIQREGSSAILGEDMTPAQALATLKEREDALSGRGVVGTTGDVLGQMFSGIQRPVANASATATRVIAGKAAEREARANVDRLLPRDENAYINLAGDAARMIPELAPLAIPGMQGGGALAQMGKMAALGGAESLLQTGDMKDAAHSAASWAALPLAGKVPLNTPVVAPLGRIGASTGAMAGTSAVAEDQQGILPSALFGAAVGAQGEVGRSAEKAVDRKVQEAKAAEARNQAIREIVAEEQAKQEAQLLPVPVTPETVPVRPPTAGEAAVQRALQIGPQYTPPAERKALPPGPSDAANAAKARQLERDVSGPPPVLLDVVEQMRRAEMEKQLLEPEPVAPKVEPNVTPSARDSMLGPNARKAPADAPEYVAMPPMDVPPTTDAMRKALELSLLPEIRAAYEEFSRPKAALPEGAAPEAQAATEPVGAKQDYSYYSYRSPSKQTPAAFGDIKGLAKAIAATSREFKENPTITVEDTANGRRLVIRAGKATWQIVPEAAGMKSDTLTPGQSMTIDLSRSKTKALPKLPGEIGDTAWDAGTFLTDGKTFITGSENPYKHEPVKPKNPEAWQKRTNDYIASAKPTSGGNRVVRYENPNYRARTPTLDVVMFGASAFDRAKIEWAEKHLGVDEWRLSKSKNGALAVGFNGGEAKFGIMEYDSDGLSRATKIGTFERNTPKRAQAKVDEPPTEDFNAADAFDAAYQAYKQNKSPENKAAMDAARARYEATLDAKNTKGKAGRPASRNTMTRGKAGESGMAAPLISEALHWAMNRKTRGAPKAEGVDDYMRLGLKRRQANTPQGVSDAIMAKHPELAEPINNSMLIEAEEKAHMRKLVHDHVDMPLSVLPHQYKADGYKAFFKVLDGQSIEDIAAAHPPEVVEAARLAKAGLEKARVDIILRSRELLAEKLAHFGDDALVKRLGKGMRADLTREAIIDSIAKNEFPDEWGKKNYIFHMFRGDWVVNVKAPGNERLQFREESEHLAKLRVMKEAKERGLSPDDFRVYRDVGRWLTEDMATPIPAQTLQKLIGDLADSTMMSPDEIRSAISGIVTPNAAREKFWGSRLQRDEYLGYSENARDVLEAYYRGYSRWRMVTDIRKQLQPKIAEYKHTRQDWSDFLQDALDRIEAKPTNTERQLDVQIENIMRATGIGDRVTPRMSARASAYVKAASAWAMLSNPRFPIVNGFQPFMTTAAYYGLVPTAKAVWAREFSPEARALLEKHNIPYWSGQYAPESGAGGRLNWWRERIMRETANTEIAFLTAYGEAKRLGMTDVEAARHAKLYGIIATQFTPLRMDTPQMMHGPVGSLVMQYKRFPIKSWELFGKLLREKKYDGVVRYLAVRAALGGLTLMATPPVIAGLNNFRSGAWARWYEKAEDEFGKTAADVMWYGLPAFAGANLSGALTTLDLWRGQNVNEAVGNVIMPPSMSLLKQMGNAAWQRGMNGSGDTSTAEDIEDWLRTIPATRTISAIMALANGDFYKRTPEGRDKYERNLKSLILELFNIRSADDTTMDTLVKAFSVVGDDRSAAIERAASPAEDWSGVERFNNLWPDMEISPYEINMRRIYSIRQAQKPFFQAQGGSRKLRSYFDSTVKRLEVAE